MDGTLTVKESQPAHTDVLRLAKRLDTARIQLNQSFGMMEDTEQTKHLNHEDKREVLEDAFRTMADSQALLYDLGIEIEAPLTSLRTLQKMPSIELDKKTSRLFPPKRHEALVNVSTNLFYQSGHFMEIVSHHTIQQASQLDGIDDADHPIHKLMPRVSEWLHAHADVELTHQHKEDLLKAFLEDTAYMNHEDKRAVLEIMPNMLTQIAYLRMCDACKDMATLFNTQWNAIDAVIPSQMQSQRTIH